MEIIKVDVNNLRLAEEAKSLFFNHEKEAINEKFFEDDKNIMLVGLLNNKVIGLVYGYGLERFSSSKKQLFIYSVDILEQHQGNGYGKQLLNKFLEPFFNNEYQEAFVFTHENNVKAVGLYKSCGAQIITSKEGHDVLLEWSR